MGLALVALLSSCSKELPAAFVAAGWTKATVTDRDHVVEHFTQWAERSSRFQGTLTIKDGLDSADPDGTWVVTRTQGWTAVTASGQRSSWDGKTMGSPDLPVTVWTRDMVAGETVADVLVCRESRCIDVTAWYTLANLDGMLTFPQTVHGLAPQDVAALSRLSSVDPWTLRYYLGTIDEPVNISVIENGNTTKVGLADRVYVQGERKGGTGTELCAGWFDRVEEMGMGQDRFIYFCFAPAAGVVSGSSRVMTVEGFEPFAVQPPAVPRKDSDLFGDLPADIRELIVVMGFVSLDWAERHTT